MCAFEKHHKMLVHITITQNKIGGHIEKLL